MAKKRTSGKALRVQGWIIDGVGYIFSSLAEAKKYLENELTQEERLLIGRDINYFKQGVNTARVSFIVTKRTLKFGKKIKLD